MSSIFLIKLARSWGMSIIALVLFIPASVQAEEIGRVYHGLFYVTSSKASITSLRKNVSSIDIVAPQTYAAKPDGTLLGKPNTEILRIANLAGAKMMPLIVNQNFSQSGIHQLLSDTTAQDKLIDALIEEAKNQGYLGFQYDFEHMQAGDRDAYSTFVERTAPRFREAGLQFSVAMSPKHSDDSADYGKGSWDNWTGAFDYARIGKAVDFVSVMAYDDSKSIGPVAALPWVQEVLTYTLDRIPADKVSLGVPFYFWSWSYSTGSRSHIGSYSRVDTLLKSRTYLKKGWNAELGTSWVTYYKGGKKLTAWYEDKYSFESKMDLVRAYHLRGFSAWALGLEDPKIWDVVLAMRAPRSGIAMR